MATQTASEQEDVCLQAMTVALQHPAVAADQRSMCTLLQVSRTWRTAVQSSAAGMTNVSFDQLHHTQQLRKVASLADWLAKHPGLLRTLNLGDPTSTEEQYPDLILEVAGQLLQLSLQAVAAGSAAGTGAPLRLQSYISNLPTSTALLAALPAGTLTSLGVMPDPSNQFSTLGNLTNLKDLRLDLCAVREEAFNSCLREVGRLTQLQKLHLFGMSVTTVAGNMQLLPAQLQSLEVEYWDIPANIGNDGDNCMDLQHLTSLNHLRIKAPFLVTGTTLPSNLSTLELCAMWSYGDLVGLANLRQVASVSISNQRLRGEQLRELERLPKLTHLSLELKYADNLLEVAAAWHSLPLQALHIAAVDIASAELQLLMQHVAAATGLTELYLCDRWTEDNFIEPPGLVVCEHLRSLRDLKKLELQIGHPRDFVVQDAQHLSALTSLTELELCFGGSGPYVDPATVSLLALSLTQLRLLSLNMHSMGETEQEVVNVSVLPAIGRLTSLEALYLDSLPDVDAERGLQLLTGLSRLTLLQGFERARSEALEAFWTTVRSQQLGQT